VLDAEAHRIVGDDDDSGLDVETGIVADRETRLLVGSSAHPRLPVLSSEHVDLFTALREDHGRALRHRHGRTLD
jgi:hypothetical protein